jgi:GNAT superfamily N-acetyltransferase
VTGGFTKHEVRAMEQAAARAWPARRIVDVAGWQVRLSGGGARRANSVLPLAFDAAADPDAAITQVERLYDQQRTRTYFQVSSIASPQMLDALLATRGYVYEEPCLLLAKRLTALGMPRAVTIAEDPSQDWLDVYTEPLDPVRRAAAPEVLANVPRKRAFFLARHDGEPVSSALAVLSPDGIAIVECVATRSTGRRRGSARIVMDALEAWAKAAGAHTAALQVVDGNEPARGLYAKRGYLEAGRYHYRFRELARS